jgi:hypothetical protein
MLENGTPKSVISNLTGLSFDEIEKLGKNNAIFPERP